MTKEELQKELTNLYHEFSNTVFNDKYEIREAFFRLLQFNKDLISSVNINTNQPTKKEINEERFIDGVRQVVANGGHTNIDILNWYNHLYRDENRNTERGIMARIIGDMLLELKYKGIELTAINYLSIDLKEDD